MLEFNETKTTESITKMKKATPVIVDKLMSWVNTLSERTLTLSAIAILHCVFAPNLLAFLNHITDKLPTIDSYLLVTSALFVMMLRSVVKSDKMAILVHMIGFVSQLTLLALILLK